MIVLLIFMFGLAVGSFLNVLADRLPKDEDIIWKRSYCDYCKKTLGVFDLIPLLSFIFLKGRCRYCRKPLSIKYPLVEIVTGLGFVYLYNHLNFFALPSPSLISLAYLFFIYSSLLVIFISDLQYLIIPDLIVFPVFLIALFYKIVYFPSQFLPYLLTAIIASLFLYLLYIITRGKGMGLGDVKYALIMGMLLGFPETVIAFYLAFLTGAFIAVILLLIGKVRLKQKIAFGPFLVLATIITILWKEQLLVLFFKYLY